MKRTWLRLILILAMALATPSTALGSPSTGEADASATTNGLRAAPGLLAALPPGGTFIDDNGHQFEGWIEAIAAEKITLGCNPPDNNRFCLEDDVTRGEMAVFLARAFEYNGYASDSFVDDGGRFYEAAANIIRREGVTQGCNPPTNNRYCGEKPITREQMAALLVRALGLEDNGGGDLFSDDDDSIYQEAIDRLGTAGITSGCNPPANDEFCPTQRVTRGQMAVFIARAIGLSPIIPPPAHGITRPPGEIVSGTITGKACANGCVVIGEATLKNDIELQGDIAVFGGTLVARPGVDLDGSGHQITFMAGGKADFQGSKPRTTWSGKGQNVTVNVVRDINFRNLRRIMFHHGAGPSTLRYFTVHNSGTSALGDYPLHWHLNGNSVRGTLVEGVAVVGGKHHAFVPHGSHGITFRDTIAKNILKPAYWWDSPCTNENKTDARNCTVDNSNDIVFDHALADNVDWPRSLGDCCSAQHRASAFVLGAGTGNVVRNSGAIRTKGGADCSGFHWPESANQNKGGTVWQFTDNFTASSSCHGIFVWQNDGERLHVIDGFSGSDIDHGAYKNNYEYRNVNVASLRVHALGWRIRDSSVGDVTVVSHAVSGGRVRFDNVSMTSFTVDNAENGGTVPGTYVLNGTNLKCGHIKYRSIVAGTRVVINNTEC
jgi:hypothetical protein